MLLESAMTASIEVKPAVPILAAASSVSRPAAAAPAISDCTRAVNIRPSDSHPRCTCSWSTLSLGSTRTPKHRTSNGISTPQPLVRAYLACPFPVTA